MLGAERSGKWLRGWLALGGLVCLLVWGISGLGRAEEDLLGDAPGGDLADDILGDLGSSWWNETWAIRRTLMLSGPGLSGAESKVVYFQEPDPLLLYNTGRCQAGLADLRVVSAEGDVLPSGVVDFGRDDGSCFVWCRLPTVERPRRGSVKLYLYYGNPAAKPESHELAKLERKLPAKNDVEAQPYEEELQAGAKFKFASPRSFFAATIPLEAEDFRAPGEAANAQPAATAPNTPPPPWLKKEVKEASGRALVVPPQAAGAQPLELLTEAEVPAAGTWRVHVRSETPSKANGYQPFELKVGVQSHTCGRPQPNAGSYQWDSFDVDLPQGSAPVRLLLAGPCAVDCVLLSRDPAYLPDYRDINGPVWMRFKVNTPAKQPYMVDMFSMHITYSVNGMQGNSTSYLFRDLAVIPRVQKPGATRPAFVKELLGDEKQLLKSGMQSPWGRAAESGSYTWFSRASFVTNENHRPLRELDVEFEFATRSDASRTFGGGSENTGQGGTVYLRMPSDTRLSAVRQMTMSFGDWARQRLALSEAMGFQAGESPKKFITSTMAQAYSSEDARGLTNIFESLGINGANINFMGTVDHAPDEILDASALTGFQDHAWATFDAVNEKLERDAGETWLAAFERDLAARADEAYRNAAAASKRFSEWQYSHTNYNVFGDEIGPVIYSNGINASPVARQLFIEYLQQQGLDPEFFGKQSWDKVEAADFAPPEESKKERGRRVNRELDAELAAGEEVPEATADALLAGPVEGEAKAQADGGRDAALMDAPGASVRKATLYGKRTYYYTQKFRSYLTVLYYRHAAAAMRKHYPPGMVGSVNLQAMPVMIGRMWDGALNIFDLGRMQAFDTLQIEDWVGEFSNVHFAAALLKAAARKHQLDVSALVVGGQPEARIMGNLMQSTRSLHFYLYGPIYNIGPVWAEDADTLRQIGQMMRQIARCEDDLLAAENRPCDAAVLVANSSEINAPFYPYPFDKERLTAFSALADAQVPVEIVGEEEILEDDALARYRILYVADPHVDRRVQEKIKAWVAAGGSLWASYAGLARTEFDEPSPLFDEVFGLESRGPVKPFLHAGYGSAEIPPGPGVVIPKSDLFQADKISGVYQGKPDVRGGLYLYPEYKLSTGKVLAKFDDGRPAIVQNKFGKGTATLCGFVAGLSYGAYLPGRFAHLVGGPEATGLRAQLRVAPAEQAGVRSHAALDRKFAGRHFVHTAVHDGPDQTLVFVSNGSSEPLENVPLTAAIDRPIAAAYSATGDEVKYTVEKGKVQIALSLPPGKGKIFVFRHK